MYTLLHEYLFFMQMLFAKNLQNFWWTHIFEEKHQVFIEGFVIFSKKNRGTSDPEYFDFGRI